MKHVKLFEEFLNEVAYVQDPSYMEELHAEIVNLLNKSKNVSEFSNYGPEDNKYAPGNYISSFQVYLQKTGTYTPEVNFKVTFSKAKMELFIANVGYFPIDKKVSGKDILKMVAKHKNIKL